MQFGEVVEALLHFNQSILHFNPAKILSHCHFLTTQCQYYRKLKFIKKRCLCTYFYRALQLQFIKRQRRSL